MTALHDFGGDVGMAFGHFLLGSHNFMGTALGPKAGVCERNPEIKSVVDALIIL